VGEDLAILRDLQLDAGNRGVDRSQLDAVERIGVRTGEDSSAHTPR